MLRGMYALSVMALVVLCGCEGGGAKTRITAYPDWNWEAYRRLAVAPFEYPRNKPGAAEAARQATIMLEDLLAANGNFQVLDRASLKQVLTEQDLSQLADVADPSTVLPPGKLQIAQALVVGKLTEFDTQVERTELRRPVYALDRNGRIRRDRAGRPLVIREEVIPVIRHVGTAGGSVRVIDAATGKVVFSHRTPPISFDDARRGSPPRTSPQDLAIQAAREMAVDCHNHLAPIRTDVKLKSEMLIVALDYYDGEYDKVKEVPTTLDQFLVAVRQLPGKCDRNRFRVALAPEGGRNIWEQEFVWTANNPLRGQSWTVPVELLRSAGGEKFVLKLYSGSDEQPLLDREFKLKPPKNEKSKGGNAARARRAKSDRESADERSADADEEDDEQEDDEEEEEEDD